MQKVRIFSIVALCCVLQMFLWAFASFWILPTHREQHQQLVGSDHHDTSVDLSNHNNSSSSGDHIFRSSPTKVAIDRKRQTPGGAHRNGITKKKPHHGGKHQGKKHKSHDSKDDDDDHYDPSASAAAAAVHTTSNKCKKRRGRGCGTPASADTDNLLKEPFFDLFDGITVADLAGLDDEKFLSVALRRIEYKPLSQQRPHHLEQHQHQSAGRKELAQHQQHQSSSSSYAKLAYALMISNEDFVDGAMVLGASLLYNSPLLRSGEAELVLVVTENRISDGTKRRLQGVGFTVIAAVPSLARFVPGAALKDTFDKIFMFALVMFERVVFMDADMLTVKSPDDLFNRTFAPSPDEEDRWVAAIGFRDGAEGDYFQTGMILYHPTALTFARVLNRFARNIPPRGRLYNLGMNGRDGVLIRDVFGSNFSEVSNKYSRNLNPRNHIPEEVISLHFRGRHKMWYDRRWPNADPENGKKEFGFNYAAWWEVYERLHKHSEEYLRLAAAASSSHSASSSVPNAADLAPYGGCFAGPGVSALSHVWMLRHTKREYVQLLHDVEEQRLKLTLPGLKVIAGKPGESCDEACKQQTLVCVPKALNFSQLNSCDVMRRFFDGCADGCEMGVYWRPHPGREFPGYDERLNKGKKSKKGVKKRLCVFNYRHDERCFPTCDAFNATTRRLCPCAPSSSLDLDPTPGDPEYVL